MKKKMQAVDSTKASDRNFRLAVGIATVGRPAILHQVLKCLEKQTIAPDAILVCAPSPADVEAIEQQHDNVKVIMGPRGLPRQRNVILDHLQDFDAVVFFDDDFIPCADYLEQVRNIMTTNEHVMMTTGRVLADGILGPGLSIEEASAIVNDFEASSHQKESDSEEVFNGYGCNMSIRLAPVHLHSIRFDEKLPLYAWLEDVDFSRQLSRFGRIIKTSATVGVHMGSKSGRQIGIRLGYSQIANPIYLARKGTCTWRRGLYLMTRNFMANSVKSLRPEPWVDRRGRLVGNMRALTDLLTGRLDPERILEF